MRTTAYSRTHDGMVRTQMQGRDVPVGALIAGDKKDLVLTNALRGAPGHIAIYGWHLASGHPIQPLNLWHGTRYADYSHGVRLVSQTVFVNGAPARLLDALADAQLGPLLSDEGALPQAAAWLASRPGSDDGRP
jgi:hypothetical protein